MYPKCYTQFSFSSPFSTFSISTCFAWVFFHSLSFPSISLLLSFDKVFVFFSPSFYFLMLAHLISLTFICFLCRMFVADGNSQWVYHIHKATSFILSQYSAMCIYLRYWFNIWSHLIPSFFLFFTSPFFRSLQFLFLFLRDNCLIAQERNRQYHFSFLPSSASCDFSYYQASTDFSLS